MPWLLAVLVRSQQSCCLIGQWEAHGCWLHFEVTFVLVPHWPVGCPWLLVVLVRSQQPPCLIGQFEASSTAGWASEVREASVPYRAVAGP